MALIFENQTSDGDSIEYPPSGRQHSGGFVQLQLIGTFDGAEVRFLISQDGLDFVTLKDEDGLNDQVFSVPDVNRVYVKRGSKMKLNLSSAGASTDISASII